MSIPTIAEIITCCADHFSVPVEIIASGSAKSRKIMLIRHIAMYLARVITYKSLNQVAQQFAPANPSTVRYAENKVLGLLTMDEKLSRDVSTILKVLRGRHV